MAFDSSENSYSENFTPNKVGNYTIPISLTDINNFNVRGYVSFSVNDTLPDVSINDLVTNYPIKANSNSTFTASISNNSMLPVYKAKVYFLFDNQFVDSLLLDSLMAYDTIQIKFLRKTNFGNHKISVAFDPFGNIPEIDETNNYRSIDCFVEDLEPPVIQFINTSSPLFEGGTIKIEADVSDNDSLISVIATFQDKEYSMVFDSTSQLWKKTVSISKNGECNIGITATDKSLLSAFASTKVKVNDTLPDLEVLEQSFSFKHIDSITNLISAIVQNRGASKVKSAKFYFIINSKINDSLSINLSGGQFDTINFTFNYSVGYHNVSFTIDPGNLIIESNESNNSISRNIFIPDLTPPPYPALKITPSIWSNNSSFKISRNKVYDNSGIVTYEYSLNGGAWTNVDTLRNVTITAPVQGINYFYLRSKDGFGNLSEIVIGEILFDNISPNAPIISELHCGIFWTKHDSPLLEWINPGDTGSGIKKFEVSIDDKNPIDIGFRMDYHPSLKSGKHFIKIRAIDYIGLEGKWSNIVKVKIDLDTPLFPKIISSTHPSPNQWYQKDSVSLNWNKPIDTSSVIGYFYMFNHDSNFHANQNSYALKDSSLVITAIPSMDTNKIRLPDGVWYIHISSQDSVGHISSESGLYKINIDKTTPFTDANHLDTVKGCKYTFNLHSEDYASGVANTFYQVNTGSWVKDTIVKLSKVGHNLIRFYSVDSAGNKEKLDSVNIYLDNNNLSINLGKDTSACGSLTIKAPKGYSYVWSNNDTTSSTTITSTQNLSLRIKDKEGCSVSDTVSIIILSVPVSNFKNINNDTQCATGNSFGFLNDTHIAKGSYKSRWDLGDNTTDTTKNINFKKYSKHGTYSVKLVNTSDMGCKDSITKTITVNASPTAKFIINQITQCFNGHSFDFDSASTIPTGRMTFVWNHGDGTTATTSNSKGKKYTDPYGTYSVKLVNTSEKGCKDSTIKTVTVNASPTAKFNINQVTQCYNGHSFNFDSASTIPTGRMTFAWYHGDGTIANTSNSRGKKYTDPFGTYSVKLVNTSINGCKDSITKTVTINASPTANFKINQVTQCFNGHSFDFDSASTIPNGRMNFAWDFGDGSTAITPNKKGKKYTDSFGTYSVQLVNISDKGCKDTFIKTVTIHASPVSSFWENDPIQCLRRNLYKFNNKSYLIKGTKFYYWSFGDGDTSSFSNPIHSFKKSATYTVKLTVKSEHGCKDTFFKSYTINPNPVARFLIKDSSQCLSSNNFILNDSSVVSNGYIISSNWTLGDGNFSTSSNLNYHYSKYGKYKIRLITFSNYSCVDTTESNVVINPQTDVSIDVNNSDQCEHKNLFKFSDSSKLISGNFISSWTFGDGFESKLKDPFHKYAYPDTFPVKLVTTTDHLCKDSIINYVNVFPQVNILLFADKNEDCLRNNNIELKDKSTLLYGKYERNWNYGDGLFSDTSINVKHSYAEAREYKIQFNTMTDHGCTDTAYKYVIIHPQTFLDFKINKDSQCISNNLYTFIDTISISMGSYSKKWSFGDGDTAFTSNAQHSYRNSGQYNVVLTTISDKGCLDTTIKSAVVHPKPIVHFELNDSFQCFIYNNFVLTNKSKILNDRLSFKWSFGDNKNSSLINPTHSYTKIGDFIIVLNAKSQYGCLDSFNKKITINPNPDIPKIKQNGVYLETNVDSAIQWFFNGMIIEGETRNFLPAKESGLYYLMVKNKHGCIQKSDSINYIFNGSKGLGISIQPNPNSGEFIVTSLTPMSKIEISNLTGQVVYSNQNISNKIKEYIKIDFPKSEYYVRIYCGQISEVFKILIIN